ncbi:AraC family ligand binding domain-containing protein [Streptomyces sp. 4N509B]|uniref:AraC family ligand binding domain-containing protein n=1 Tax=Streptomyces sp. 4N509B TaxID=3457413 RepID=UPI003FD10825
MRAHFTRHVFRPHSHDAYLFGVTESGAQRFRCRGAEHVSSAGMVMALNADEPHDGSAAVAPGFTYRMVHLGPEVVREVLGGAALPLFDRPVIDDPALRRALLRLHHALAGGAGRLVRDERLAEAVTAMVRGAARRPGRPAHAVGQGRAAGATARRARELLTAEYARDIGADELAEAAGCSRFALYRAVRATYGVSPSELQRLVRLRAARRMLAAGTPAAEAATACGFADQSHLSRWFVRSYGITPGAYARAAGRAGE